MKEFVFLVLFHIAKATGDYHVGGTIGPLGDGKGDPVEMMAFCLNYKKDVLDPEKKSKFADPVKKKELNDKGLFEHTIIYECISATERPKNTIPDEVDTVEKD